MFKRIFIANRGEIISRIIKSIHKLGAKAVVGYSLADKNESYLKDADDIICIGDKKSSLSYLNQDSILQAAIQTNCQALHPGFGFLSENAIFANRCNQQKLKFIGPKAESIRLMGNKLLARLTMNKHKLFGLPNSKSSISSFKQIEIFAKKNKYPLLLKAIHGGGGKGIRLIQNKNELKSKFISASNETEKSFGNKDLYIEKYLTSARHIEFQILSDAYGNVIHLGERDCSIQRNHQKLIEEAPANNISNNQRQKIGKKICKIIKKISYEGVGTIEFLLDSEDNFYFMEMNTRLQVEHAITEMITGLDLVSWQIKIASGEKLTIKQKDIKIQGHAIECRINAENPYENFNPSPGKITQFNIPKNNMNGPLRIDTHIVSGSEISVFYDSMIAKIITLGKNRSEAIKYMRESLNKIKIEGVKTTKKLHQNIINNHNFINGTYNCSFLKDNKIIKF